MRQDETGRWTSDDGRYFWDGTSWVDADSGDRPDARSPGDPAPGDRSPGDRSADDRSPGDRSADDRSQHDRPDVAAGTADVAGPARTAGPVRDDSAAATPSAHARHRGGREDRGGQGGAAHRNRNRSLTLLVVLVVLAAGGTGAVLLFGRNAKPMTAPRATNSPVAPSSPDAAATAMPSGAVLDEPQRRMRAMRALLQRGEIPGATEQRPASPTDVFLPCQAPPLVPPPGSVIVGQTLGNTDFTVYVGQTVVGFPTEQAAADALASIRSVADSCKPYDFRYVNSDRFDRITHTDVDPALALGDGGVYLAEVDTPGNYNGAPTTYSYGYVRQGQFLVRLTLTNNSAADRPGLELLVRRTLDRLR